MLSAHNLKLSFGARVILDDVSFSLLPKERVALVGQNGVGKSSLLRLLAGEPPDSGRLEMGRQARIELLDQIPNLNNDWSVIDVVRSGMAFHIEAILEHQRLCETLALMPASQERDKLVAKVDKLANQIEHGGGFDIDHRIDNVLSRLGIKMRMQQVSLLSGGEKRRVDLARILLSAPDVYLLDEPTNHLDIGAVQFLVETFSLSRSAVLFVSHDSAFIDELATRIVELAYGKIYTHEPPFANYLENKLVREIADGRTLHRRERLVAGELAWLRAGTPARTTKQSARIDRAHSLIEQVARDSQAQRDQRLQVETSSNRLGKTIIELDRVGAAFGQRTLFQDFSLKVTSGQRYGILGRNGSGKTTLLSILAGRAAPTFGQVTFGKNTQILEFDQHREQLDPNATLKETLADHGEHVMVAGRSMHVASYLEKYLFSASGADRRVKTLSGGEQNRLLLAKLFRKSANCLLLDEPTNDLDTTSMAVLEEVLLDHEGVSFIISHDRRFLDRVCNTIIAFELAVSGAENHLALYSGNCSDYLRSKCSNELKSHEPKKVVTKEERIKPKRRRSYKEEQEFNNIESMIECLEEEKVTIHSDLAKAHLFRDEPWLVQHKIERMRTVELEIERLYARWQQLLDLGG